MPVSLVTMDEAREFIGIHVGDEDYDPILTTLVYSATEMLENYTRRTFAETTYTERFNTRQVVQNAGSFFIHNARNTFHLKAKPVDKGAGFTVYYNPVYEFTADYLIDETTNSIPNWELDEENGILYLYVDTDRLSRVVQVNYTGGYTVTTGTGIIDNMSDSAPSELKHAALIQIAHMFKKHRELSFNNSSEQKRTGSGMDAVRVGGLTAEAMGHANNHKLNLTGSRP